MEITKETCIALGVAGFMQGYKSVAGRGLTPTAESWSEAAGYLENHMEAHGDELLIAGPEFIALCWLGGRIHAYNCGYETQGAPEAVRLMGEELAQEFSGNDSEPAGLPAVD